MKNVLKIFDEQMKFFNGGTKRILKIQDNCYRSLNILRKNLMSLIKSSLSFKFLSELNNSEFFDFLAEIFSQQLIVFSIFVFLFGVKYSDATIY